MKKLIFSLFLISLFSINCQCQLINSSTPYSSGIVSFGNHAELYFSTGLELKVVETSHISYETDYMLCPLDYDLYTSYAAMQGDYVGEDNDGNKVTHLGWDEITSVDTTINFLDQGYAIYGEIVNGHYIYNHFRDWTEGADILNLHSGLTDVLISQDSSGNYIKWQIAEVIYHLEFNNSSDDLYSYYVLDSITMKWAIDSCGNGQFRGDPVSNSEVIAHKEMNSSRYVQKEQKLVFPEYKNLSISLFTPKGRQIRMSDGAGNFIDLSGLSRGIYFAQIKNNSTAKSIRFTID